MQSSPSLVGRRIANPVSVGRVGSNDDFDSESN
jgi:hypothetical protein